MKKFIYPAVFFAPVACMVTSCSEPYEEVEDYMEELSEVIKDNEDESLVDLIDAVHEYTQDETPDLVDTLVDLDEAERKVVVEKVIKSDAMKLLVKRVLQAAIAQAVDHPEIIRTVIEMTQNHYINEEQFFETMSDILPYETQMQLIDIAGDMVKIAVAAGLDQRAVQKEAEAALREVVAAYVPVRKMMQAPHPVSVPEEPTFNSYSSGDYSYESDYTEYRK